MAMQLSSSYAPEYYQGIRDRLLFCSTSFLVSVLRDNRWASIYGETEDFEESDKQADAYEESLPKQYNETLVDLVYAQIERIDSTSNDGAEVYLTDGGFTTLRVDDKGGPDRWDILSAWVAYLMPMYSGQWSREYARLSTAIYLLQRNKRPVPQGYEDLGPDAAFVFGTILQRFPIEM